MTPLGFYASGQIYKGYLNDFGIKLTTRHKMKTMSHINEPLNPLDSEKKNTTREGLTLRLHASMLILFIDLKNYGSS